VTVRYWAGIGNSGQSAGIGDWSTAANWTPADVPQNGDTMVDQGGDIIATNVGLVSGEVLLNYEQAVPVGLTLDGSSLGPSTYTVLDSPQGVTQMVLENSNLQGIIFADNGATDMTVAQNKAAVNWGWVGIANQSGHASIVQQTYGNFGNAGDVIAGQNGQYNLFFDAFPSAYTWNTGLIQAGQGGSVLLQSEASSAQFLNLGVLDADGGSVDAQTNILQSQSGVISVTNGGTLTLSGATDGGTIKIDSGMLDFGGTGPDGPNPYGAWNFNSTVDFTGPSATLDFGENISATYQAGSNDLQVSLPYAGGTVEHQIQLAGAYTANEFTVSGSQILFNAQPTS
jgi:hypothetical protein